MASSKRRDFYGSGTKLVNVVDIYQSNHIVDTNPLELVEAGKNEVKVYQVNKGDIFFVRSSLKSDGVGASACEKSFQSLLFLNVI